MPRSLMAEARVIWVTWGASKDLQESQLPPLDAPGADTGEVEIKAHQKPKKIKSLQSQVGMRAWLPPASPPAELPGQLRRGWPPPPPLAAQGTGRASGAKQLERGQEARGTEAGQDGSEAEQATSSHEDVRSPQRHPSDHCTAAAEPLRVRAAAPDASSIRT